MRVFESSTKTVVSSLEYVGLSLGLLYILSPTEHEVEPFHVFPVAPVFSRVPDVPVLPELTGGLVAPGACRGDGT